jgi:hypothetical protein
MPYFSLAEERFILTATTGQQQVSRQYMDAHPVLPTWDI